MARTIKNCIDKANTYFSSSSYYKSKKGSAAPSYGELMYWANKIRNGNMSDSLSQAEFTSVYSYDNVEKTDAGKDLYNDKIAQEFIINADDFPNGIFLQSIGLYFFYKDYTKPEKHFPVKMELTDIKNDYPNSKIFKEKTSSVTISAKYIENTINALATTNENLVETVFTFPELVYLAPGSYAFIVSSHSSEYKLGVVQKNTIIRNSTKLSSKKMSYRYYQSDQNDQWDTFTDKNICFSLKRADFKIGETKTTNATLYIDSTKAKKSLYDHSFVTLKTPIADFGDLTDTTYTLSTYSFGMSDINGTTISPNTQAINVGEFINFGDLQTMNYLKGNTELALTMTTTNKIVSPYVDLSLNSFNYQTFKHVINSKTLVGNSEALPFKGRGTAKYITKKVILQEGFDSTGLTVTIDVCRPASTDIEVFVKVKNRYDNAIPEFNDHNWIQLTRTYPTTTTYHTSITAYTEEKYQNLALSYTANNEITNYTTVNYNDFSEYSVKVVFLSDKNGLAPRIRNLRAVSSL